MATAVTNSRGEVIACRRDSLLVRDVPLSAWVSMLRDPQNIFGKAFEIRDEQSALPVMELFRELELPEEAVPHGPVSLLEAVLPYIEDAESKASVEYQIGRFLQDQAKYAEVATARAKEWLQFEKELADSLHSGWATPAIEGFIGSLQHQWGDDDLALIKGHDMDGQYAMSRGLAARLEKAKQNLLHGIAAVETGNDKVMEQMDEAQARELQEQITFLRILEASGVSAEEIAMQQASLNRTVAQHNLVVGGGCAGENRAKFKDGPDDGTDGEAADEDGTRSQAADPENKSSWKWKSGVCRVPRCGSPKPTKVGPCDVCVNCQHAFDRGQDPTKSILAPVAKETPSATDHVDDLLRGLSEQFEKQQRSEEIPVSIGRSALALVG
jgi:hypothetical protein